MIGVVNIVYREWVIMCVCVCWNGGYLCFMHFFFLHVYPITPFVS